MIFSIESGEFEVFLLPLRQPAIRDSTFGLVESTSNVLTDDEGHLFGLSMCYGDFFLLRQSKSSKDLEIVCQSNAVPFSSISISPYVSNTSHSSLYITGSNNGSGVSRLVLENYSSKIPNVSSVTFSEIPKLVPNIVVEITSDSCDEALVCYNIGESSKIGYFRENIPHYLESRSDQVFRGTTGIWTLKQYGMDLHHSMVVISFVKSTILLQVDQNSDFVDHSEFYGIDTHSRTLAIGNTLNGSFLLQVCPKRINICKSNAGETAGEVIASWESSKGSDENDYFSSASIFADLVFALDIKKLRISIFQCRVRRGNFAVNKLCQVQVCSETSAFAIFSTEDPVQVKQSTGMSPKSFVSPSEFLLVCSSPDGLNFWRVQLDENSSRVDLVKSVSSTLFSQVNSLEFSRNSFGIRLYLGLRNGTVQILELDYESNTLRDIKRKYEFSVGHRPVRLLTTDLLTGKDTAVVALSGKALLITETTDMQFRIEPLLEKADHMVRFQEMHAKSDLAKFLVIEHEALLSFSTNLEPTMRVVPILRQQNARFVGGIGPHIVTISSPRFQYKQQSTSSFLAPEVLVFSSQDDELLYRTVLAAGDVVTAMDIVDNQTIALGICVNDVGQLRILRIPQLQRRRQSGIHSLTGSRGGPPTQLIFACDAGFPHPVTAISTIPSKEDQTCSLIVSAGTDIHILSLDQSKEIIEFIHTETWRAAVLSLASNHHNRVAVSSERAGLELFSLDENGDWTLMWSAAKPDSVTKIVWCNENLVAGLDRRGFIHFLHCDQEGAVSRVTRSIDGDIPLAALSRADYLFITGVSGCIHKMELPTFYDNSNPST